MKKPGVNYLVFLILFSFVSVIADCQESMAHIYLYRIPNYVGSAEKMTILVNGKPAVRLKNACYFVVEAIPGDYVIKCATSPGISVNIKAEEGKEYYVNCYLNQGFWASIPILELTDPAYGKSAISGMRLTQLFPEEVVIKPRYSRIGLYIGGGPGFENTPWFQDAKGRNVTLSTGGGFSAGLDMGFLVSRHLDIAGSLLYQESSLSENLSNADGNFSRVAFLVTPSFVIPIHGGENVRLRIGAGPGIYSGGKMKIEGAQAGGYDFTLRYGTAVGFHGIFAVNSRMMEKGSIDLGLKYVNVKYNYESNDKGYSVSGDEILNPDGSGIEFFIGYYLQF